MQHKTKRDRTDEIKKLEKKYKRVDVWADQRKNKILTKITKLKQEQSP